MLTVDQRVNVERRLLAALFLWPRHVDISPRDFSEPEHGAIYEVICDAAQFYVPAELEAHTLYYDSGFLEVVIGFARDYAAEKRRAMRGYHGDPAGWAAHVRTYFESILLRQPVTRDQITELVQLVRQCPRCGK
jgi:hypothetical protein